MSPIDNLSYDPRGLTEKQVNERVRDGRVNRTKNAVSKPLSRILIDNIVTPFNLVNAIIAAALIAVGSYHNILFFGVVACNTVIGIVQELRTKRTLEKLSLLCAATVEVMRSGERRIIPADELVEGDLFYVQNGDQISVDARVINGAAEINESLLTGEIEPIPKRTGDTLYSGSFVVSGRVAAIAEKVGDACYAAQLSADAKAFKRLSSQLLNAINKIIRFTGIFMIPFAAALIARDIFSGDFTLKSTVTSTAAALIGMMPQGLILLTTVALMVGVVKLAREKTLVRELYCIETLSRVSLLCLDKTGTITKGRMHVCDIVPLSDSLTADARQALIAEAISAIGDTNATAIAVRAYFEEHPAPYSAHTVREIRPFSSNRKWSAVALEGIGSLFLGAYDRLLPHTSNATLTALENEGKRVLLVAKSDALDIDNAKDTLVPIAAVVLKEELRDNAAEILNFFQNEDVTLRVISGDHPRTVAAVAAEAGLRNADRFVDASTLGTPEQLREAAATYTVFGRVTPEQKRELVRCFQEQGHTVAMTGDGVNDVPALKAADCSIAMAAGSDAAKSVSQLVLLHSDFAALPAVVMEGRRVVNNITRTASLFLVKTVMSFLITLAAIFLPMEYPFEPLQLTLVGIFAESVPGFFLTLEPSRERIKGNFLHTVLSSAVPSAVIITLYVVLIQLALAPLLDLTAAQSSTLCVYITGFVWLVQLWRVCHPFTPARHVLWIGMTVGFFGSAILLAHALPMLFAALGYTMAAVFVLPTVPMLLAGTVLALISFPLDHALYRAICRRFEP